MLNRDQHPSQRFAHQAQSQSTHHSNQYFPPNSGYRNSQSNVMVESTQPGGFAGNPSNNVAPLRQEGMVQPIIPQHSARAASPYHSYENRSNSNNIAHQQTFPPSQHPVDYGPSKNNVPPYPSDYRASRHPNERPAQSNNSLPPIHMQQSSNAPYQQQQQQHQQPQSQYNAHNPNQYPSNNVQSGYRGPVKESGSWNTGMNTGMQQSPFPAPNTQYQQERTSNYPRHQSAKIGHQGSQGAYRTDPYANQQNVSLPPSYPSQNQNYSDSSNFFGSGQDPMLRREPYAASQSNPNQNIPPPYNQQAAQTFSPTRNRGTVHARTSLW